MGGAGHIEISFSLERRSLVLRCWSTEFGLREFNAHPAAFAIYLEFILKGTKRIYGFHLESHQISSRGKAAGA
jgi:hypothetical protein